MSYITGQFAGLYIVQARNSPHLNEIEIHVSGSATPLRTSLQSRNLPLTIPFNGTRPLYHLALKDSKQARVVSRAGGMGAEGKLAALSPAFGSIRIWRAISGTRRRTETARSAAPPIPPTIAPARHGTPPRFPVPDTAPRVPPALPPGSGPSSDPTALPIGPAAPQSACLPRCAHPLLAATDPALAPGAGPVHAPGWP